jgi:hypothetical protein
MPFVINQSTFSGVESIGSHMLISQIENNIKSFLDWGFLHIGGFINVNKPQQNIYGNYPALLKPTSDPNYNDGQVWQTMRKDWIYEDGITYNLPVYPSPPPSPFPAPPAMTGPTSVSPIQITGIYIQNVFYPLNTVGAYSYIVDYVNSRIIFNTAINTNLKVEMEYAYRWCQVYTYDNAKWWQQLQYKTDQNAAHFTQLQQGDFSVLSVNRVQLPAIIIQSIARGQSTPYRLGDKSLNTKQEIMLHVMAETMSDRNVIIDIIRLQQDKIMRLYDNNLVAKNGVGPFYPNGTLNPNRLQYDELLVPYYTWNTARLTDIYASEVQSFSPFLAEANIRFSCEITQLVQN